MKESDLYLPLKWFLESQDYEVKGEVQDCDVVAVRGKEAPVVIELKLSLNLNVILQEENKRSLFGRKERTKSPRVRQLSTLRLNNRIHADMLKRTGGRDVHMLILCFRLHL